jgi:hypothetical protein
MCFREPDNQGSPRVDAEFPADTFEVRPNGAGGQLQETSSLAFVVVQHKALKNLDFALREAQRLGDAYPGGFTEEASAIAGFIGIIGVVGHREPLTGPRILNCDSAQRARIKSAFPFGAN